MVEFHLGGSASNRATLSIFLKCNYIGALSILKCNYIGALSISCHGRWPAGIGDEIRAGAQGNWWGKLFHCSIMNYSVGTGA